MSGFFEVQRLAQFGESVAVAWSEPLVEVLTATSPHELGRRYAEFYGRAAVRVCGFSPACVVIDPSSPTDEWHDAFTYVMTVVYQERLLPNGDD